MNRRTTPERSRCLTTPPMTLPSPRPHQATALHRFSGEVAAFFAMEMRLGKSLTSLWWMRQKSIEYKLIVAPLCTHASWCRDIEDKLGERVVLLPPRRRQDWFDQQACNMEEYIAGLGGKDVWFLTNWERLATPGHKTRGGKPKAVASPIAEFPWEGVILDESPKIRNPGALVTQVVLRHLRFAKYKACLSGLPAPESPLDYVNQMVFLRGEFAGYRSWWDARNDLWRKVGYDYVPRPGVTKQFREEFHKHAYVVTRKELGLGVEPMRITRTCQMGPEAAKLYREVEGEWAWDDDWAGHALRVQIWLAGIASGWPAHREECWYHKLNLLTQLLTGDDEPELARKPVIVWAQFRREINAIEGALSLCGVKVRTLTGSTTRTQRPALEQDLRAGRYRVLVAQYQAGAYGMDLSCAVAAIRFSYTYSYQILTQSEARTESMDRKKPTLLINLVTENTVDEDVVETLALKKLNAKLFIQNVVARIRARVHSVKAVASTR